MRKPWLVAALLALAASCGTETDDRPATAEYISTAITRPSCGTAACHSSATARNGVILDTQHGLCCATYLGFYVTGKDDEGRAFDPRMPLDSPLPDRDINLILGWEDDDRPGCETVVCQ